MTEESKRDISLTAPGSPEQSIKAQYEAFPYPVRDPADESHRLLKTIIDGIPSINHFVFGGKFDFSRALRILVAGGGTGDTLIYGSARHNWTKSTLPEVHAPMSRAQFFFVETTGGFENSIDKANRQIQSRS